MEGARFDWQFVQVNSVQLPNGRSDICFKGQTPGEGAPLSF
jgi:hypothetical protein